MSRTKVFAIVKLIWDTLCSVYLLFTTRLGTLFLKLFDINTRILTEHSIAKCIRVLKTISIQYSDNEKYHSEYFKNT